MNEKREFNVRALRTIMRLESELAEYKERVKALESAFAELQPALLATADFAHGFRLLEGEEGEDHED